MLSFSYFLFHSLISLKISFPEFILFSFKIYICPFGTLKKNLYPLYILYVIPNSKFSIFFFVTKFFKTSILYSAALLILNFGFGGFLFSNSFIKNS